MLINIKYNVGFSGKYRLLTTNVERDNRTFRDKSRPIMNKVLSSVMSKHFKKSASWDKRSVNSIFKCDKEHIFARTLGNSTSKMNSLFKELTTSHAVPTITFLNNWQNLIDLPNIIHKFKSLHDEINREHVIEELRNYRN